MSALPETQPRGALDARSMPPVSAILLRIARVVMRWEQRRLNRRALLRLDDHMLRDVGLDRSMVDAEISRPLWRD